MVIIYQAHPARTTLYSYENEKTCFYAFDKPEIFFKSLC